jgi:hypothetical protein
MHRLLALIDHRRLSKVKVMVRSPFWNVTESAAVPLTVKSPGSTVFSLTASDRLTTEVCRLSEHHAVTGRVSAGHGKTNQLPVSERHPAGKCRQWARARPPMK